MPADESLPQTSSSRHRDASKPYECSERPQKPGGQQFIDYGWCRTSLDYHKDIRHEDGTVTPNPQGTEDPRCAKNCPHKAPLEVAVKFMEIWPRGVPIAADWAVRALENDGNLDTPVRSLQEIEQEKLEYAEPPF